MRKRDDSSPSLDISNYCSVASGSCPVARKPQVARPMGRRGTLPLSELRAIQNRAREIALETLGAESVEALESDDCPTERCIQITSSFRSMLESVPDDERETIPDWVRG